LSGPKESCEKAGEPTITIINAVSRLESDGKEREIVPPQRESENEREREREREERERMSNCTN